VRIGTSTEHDDLDATGLRAARFPAKTESDLLVRELHTCAIVMYIEANETWTTLYFRERKTVLVLHLEVLVGAEVVGAGDVRVFPELTELATCRIETLCNFQFSRGRGVVAAQGLPLNSGALSPRLVEIQPAR
jgi:hypothetical protein